MNFQYDGTERRVYRKDVVSGVTTEALYLHDGMNSIHERTKTGSVTEYIYGPTGIIALKTGASWKYVIKDHLGSTRAVVDGTTVTGYDYSAFGNVLAPATPNTAYMYTGQEYDKTSGLHNFKARMYDSDLMRFYGVDPAGELAYSYGYGANNPLSYRDPDGKFIQFVIMGAMMGGYFGAVQADMQGKSVWEGFAKGAFVGGIGGALGGVANPAAWGGMQSVLVGAAEGVATNGLSNVLNGKNFFKGWQTSAAIGGAFGLVRSEQFGNAVRGDGWQSNKQVFDNWMAEPNAANDSSGFIKKQRVINRFSPKGGEYEQAHDAFVKDPDARAFTDPKSGRIVFNKPAFDSYEQFRYASFHETGHVTQRLQGRLHPGINDDQLNSLERESHLMNYRNEGLYRYSSMRDYSIGQINHYAPIEIYADGSSNEFRNRWFHFIYRIPRVY